MGAKQVLAVCRAAADHGTGGCRLAFSSLLCPSLQPLCTKVWSHCMSSLCNSTSSGETTPVHPSPYILSHPYQYTDYLRSSNMSKLCVKAWYLSACPSALNLLGVSCLFPLGLLVGGFPASSHLQAPILSCARKKPLTCTSTASWAVLMKKCGRDFSRDVSKISWLKMLPKPILKFSLCFSLVLLSGKYFLTYTGKHWS